MINSLWRIDLFGGLQLSRADELISRFQTRKTAALLAYLAFYRDKVVSRDFLTDLFWPENDPDAARNSLRVALTSLRRQLEPPGVSPGTVLIADRASVHLNAAVISTDVADFEAALRDEKAEENDPGRMAALLRAVDLYRGALLTGWYEEWIELEQTRLAEVYAGALRRVTTLLTRAGDYERALDYAQRAVSADPLREETNRNLMRLFAVLGRPSAAREQYRRMESLLLKELGATPSSATRELMKQITAGAEKLVEAAAAKGLREAPTTMLPSPSAPVAAAAPAAVPDSNIPTPFTRFVGREGEMIALEAALSPGSDTRLVTLTGPGGTGKTRLSVEIAMRLRDRVFGGCVWTVPLVDLSEASQIPKALLGALRLTPSPEIAPLDQIEATLCGSSPCLVVLDNLEQIADQAADVVETLLQRLPNVTILATSRQRLAVRGEHEFLVPPLPTPPPEQSALEALSANPSIALFLDRARAVRPDFQITPRNAAPIAALVRRLDGLPLALELAAAGVRLLSPQQMLDRLTERSDLLGVERRDLTARHRSLRAVMDESFRLLPAEAHGFFARLSVFRGGWTLEAASAVCGDEDALELLDLLEQRSLIVSADVPAGVRFRFLETIRQYAASKLSLEETVALHAAHARYFAAFAEEMGDALCGTQSEAASDLLESEYDNLRAAIAVFLASDTPEDVAQALRTGTALWRFWYARGHVEEGLTVLETAIARAGDRFPALGGRAHQGAGRLSLNTGNAGAASAHFAAAADCLVGEATFDPVALLMDRAIAGEASGDDVVSEAAYQHLAEIYRERGDLWAESCALTSLAALLQANGDEREAERLYEQSAANRRALGDVWAGSFDAVASQPEAGIAASFLQLGFVALEQGDYPVALPLLRDALSAYRRLGDDSGAAIAQERIALTALRQGDLPTAHRAAEEALLLRRRDRRSLSQAEEGASAKAHAFAENILRSIDYASKEDTFVAPFPTSMGERILTPV